MSSHTIVLLPGDGIGPEIVAAAKRVIDAAGVTIEWREVLAGIPAIDAYRDPLPEHTLAAIREVGVALKGPITTPIGSGFRSINVALRQEFDLHMNLRPARSFEGVASRYENIDLVIVRENTEGLYSGIEHYIGRDRSAAEAVTIITRAGSERIARAAFEYARAHGRKKVTIVHKANILKFTSGLFLATAREVAREFPDIACDDKIVDNTAMQLVLNPHQFDVLVTTNLFGDILSDLASGLVGGLGLAPGANIGTTAAIFEPVHGSAPDIAGLGIANPCAEILAAVMMLDYIGESAAAARVEQAVRRVIARGTHVTRDLKPGSTTTTAEMADAIVAELR
jgi:isocitrate dehydrogenase (NAD+)